MPCLLDDTPIDDSHIWYYIFVCNICFDQQQLSLTNKVNEITTTKDFNPPYKR